MEMSSRPVPPNDTKPCFMKKYKWNKGKKTERKNTEGHQDILMSNKKPLNKMFYENWDLQSGTFIHRKTKHGREQLIFFDIFSRNFKRKNILGLLKIFNFEIKILKYNKKL